MRINGHGRRNDDEDQVREIDPARPIFNLIPYIQNQRRLVVGFDDTSDKEVDFGEFANLHGRQQGGRQWQPNYRGDDEYKLRVDIPNFSDDLDIKGRLDWFD